MIGNRRADAAEIDLRGERRAGIGHRRLQRQENCRQPFIGLADMVDADFALRPRLDKFRRDLGRRSEHGQRFDRCTHEFGRIAILRHHERQPSTFNGDLQGDDVWQVGNTVGQE